MGTLLDGIRYKLRDDADWTHVPAPDHFKGFAVQLDHFVKCARGETTPIVTGEDGLRSIAAVEAAYRAGADGRWVSLDEMEG